MGGHVSCPPAKTGRSALTDRRAEGSAFAKASADKPARPPHRLSLALAALLLLTPTLHAIPGQPGPAPKEAWLITVKNSWEITGALPENLLLIGLQGLANTDAPRVYIEYPVDWKFRDFNPLKDFYASRYGIKFNQLETPDAALAALGRYAKGYVVWDRQVRSSIYVALTAAGVLRAAVVDESLIPLAEKHGLKPLADFRGQFAGMTDVQINRWALVSRNSYNFG